MKKLSFLLSAVIWLSVSGADLPLAIGGYHYEARRVASEVAVKNCWLYKLTTPTPAEYKNYSVVYLGELIKNAPAEVLWNTPENRKLVVEYLNNGGVIVTSKDMPRVLFGKTVKKEAGKIFGFNRIFAIKPDAVAGAKIKGAKDTVIWNRVAAVSVGGVSADVEVLATYDPESKGGNSPDGRKVKGTLHWVSAKNCIDFEARLYDRLFNNPNPSDESSGSFKDNLNPDSLTILEGCKLEDGVENLKVGDTFQFMRQGYFCIDTTSTDDKIVFNRTVDLKSSWK